MDLVAAGMSLITVIAQLITKALQGDHGAQDRLRRVEQVLVDSPTEQAWTAALERAKRKPLAVPVIPAPPTLPRGLGGIHDLPDDEG